jgi:hypothetical protein
MADDAGTPVNAAFDGYVTKIAPQARLKTRVRKPDPRSGE